MAQYIDKDALVAEIKNIKENIGIGLNAYDDGIENGKSELCDVLLSFIDTLVVKQL